MKQLFRFLEHHKKESILAPLFKMLEALFDLFVPLIMADIINVGIAENNLPYILRRCLLMILLGIIGLACSITAQYFASKAAVEASAGIRHDLFAKIQSLDFAETDGSGTGTLITRMTSDVNQVQNGLNMFLRLFLRSPFVVLGAMLLAFTINKRAALIFVIVIPVLSLVIFGIMLKTIPLYRKVQGLLDRLTVLTRENLTGVRVVRAFAREKEETAQFRAADGALLSAQLSVGRLSALMNPLTYTIISIAVIAILKAGAIEVRIGAMRTGDVIALVNYMNQILIELVKLANLIIQMTKASACAGRINAVLALKPEMRFGTEDLAQCSRMPGLPSSAQPLQGGQPLPQGQPLSGKTDPAAIAFSHVSLSYAGAAESLSDISFTVRQGQAIGIIGGTGSGKTSLGSLLPRYYDASAGEIRLFGKDIRAFSKESLRHGISTVMQRAQLFSGTIRSNLLWGNADASDDEIWSALEIAQASEVVRSKEKQLDEPVEQGGRNFSGGQKQRLSIARSILAHPAILILDDSSSALDYATDAALRKALQSLPRDLTVLIVSQRTASLQHADQILVLDDGRLVGTGTHAELVNTCSVYRDIYESQFRQVENPAAPAEAAGKEDVKNV